LGLFFDCNSPKHQDLKIALFKAINRNWQKYGQRIMPQSHLYSESFVIDSIKETVYQGTLDPFPKALFVVMINDKLRKRIHNNMLK
jgi:hypothetical protein